MWLEIKKSEEWKVCSMKNKAVECGRMLAHARSVPQHAATPLRCATSGDHDGDNARRSGGGGRGKEGTPADRWESAGATRAEDRAEEWAEDPAGLATGPAGEDEGPHRLLYGPV